VPSPALYPQVAPQSPPICSRQRARGQIGGLPPGGSLRSDLWVKGRVTAHWLILLLALFSCWVQANPSLKQPGFHTRAAAPLRPDPEFEPAPRNRSAATEPTVDRPKRYCEADYPGYAKTLLVTRLANPNANHENRQGLLGIEHALPRRLGHELTSQGTLVLFRETGRELHQGQDSAEPLRQAAHRADTQLVLSGKLISTSGPDRNRGLVVASRDALVAGLGLNPDWDSRQRQFVLALRLHDGMTGELLWHQIYHTQGVWRTSQAPTSSQFQSPTFRRNHYGAQVEALLDEVLAELSQVIRCQPLAGWLTDRGPGTRPLLALGRQHGLSEGDELSVYRIQRQPVINRYRSYRLVPIDTGHQVRILESQAHQSRVEWLGPGARPGRYLVITPSGKPQSHASEGELVSEED